MDRCGLPRAQGGSAAHRAGAGLGLAPWVSALYAADAAGLDQGALAVAARLLSPEGEGCRPSGLSQAFGLLSAKGPSGLQVTP